MNVYIFTYIHQSSAKPVKECPHNIGKSLYKKAKRHTEDKLHSLAQTLELSLKVIQYSHNTGIQLMPKGT